MAPLDALDRQQIEHMEAQGITKAAERLVLIDRMANAGRDLCDAVHQVAEARVNHLEANPDMPDATPDHDTLAERRKEFAAAEEAVVDFLMKEESQ